MTSLAFLNLDDVSAAKGGRREHLKSKLGFREPFEVRLSLYAFWKGEREILPHISRLIPFE